MIEFKPVTKKDGGKLRKYYKNCDYGLCEYSVGTVLMWRRVLRPAWAEVAGCLVIKKAPDGRTMFEYPVPGSEGDVDAALLEIEKHCMEKGIPPVFAIVPEQKTAHLLARYPYVHVSDIRTWRDYIYRREDLQSFTGKLYNGQRNHIRRFKNQWPDAKFQPLTKADDAMIQRFWQDFEAEFPKMGNDRARNELKLAKEMLKLLDKPWFVAGGIFDGDRLIALSLAERCGETLIIHIEKALRSYPGVYPTLVQEFTNAFGGDFRWINREDDSADKGLRTSKTQYGPVRLGPKYCIEPQNELLKHVNAIPELTTQRLTLSALTTADAAAYNALVLDRERNRWWGYDDVGSLGGPPEEQSFLKVAWRDFENRLAVNFAVRLDGELIGEAVLYNFDYRGGAELGCRIDGAHAGFGYGAEAFAAVADWGLYQVQLTRVVAKYLSSYKMLSGCMRRSSEDETFYYFEKLI